MKVGLNVDDRKKFHILLTIFSFVPPFNGLSKREKQVLAELYYYYNKLDGIEENKRQKLIFDYDTRREIAEHIDVKTDQIYNVMSLLRKKGLIEKSKLVQKYIIKDVDELTFEFNGKLGN
jgi:DNA-binding MarR family transcriptional regulator